MRFGLVVIIGSRESGGAVTVVDVGADRVADLDAGQQDFAADNRSAGRDGPGDQAASDGDASYGQRFIEQAGH
ncbi:hypothetical protein D3C85_897610 [compost metagenome]